MNLPAKCVVDTNVPITANKALSPDYIPGELISCVRACVEAIDHVIKKRGLVIDAGDEIFDEYLDNLSLRGQPGVGDRFMKWVHDHRYDEKFVEQVSITKNGNSYNEFPNHNGLKNFDDSDRKFVAVANAHQKKGSSD